MAEKQKEDLRIVRTRKLLSNTLLDMMETESIEKISVIDLCNEAMVNRATFYAHFEDKYHLLDFALEELKDTIYEKFTKEVNKDTPGSMVTSLVNLAVDFLFDQQNHIMNIILNNRNGRIVETVSASLASSLKYQLAKFKEEYTISVPLSILSNFIAGGMISVALIQIDNPNKYTKEDLKKYCDTAHLVNRYFKKKEN
ncbi:MAG: TetR/AcrR family transcriptional regulator [Clostridia bacterium]|nr:TetR/AcrR family transcriptional regulator [Clostridia bacterium]